MIIETASRSHPTRYGPTQRAPTQPDPTRPVFGQPSPAKPGRLPSFLTQPGSTPARRTRRPFLAVACWGYLLAMIAVWLIMRQAGDRWWVATVLLIAPRWPFAVPLAVLGVWALAARRWWSAAATGAAAGVVLCAIMGFRVAMPSSAPARGELRLLTCNVHRQHLNAERMARFIREVQPDVIALQGWSDANHEALFGPGGVAGGKDWDVRRQGELLVASRFPIGSVTALDLADSPDTPQAERGAAALFELRTSKGPVSLIALHLASPHVGLLTLSGDMGGKLGENIRRRWHESGQLRALTDLVRGPLLLAGDFNTTDDSPIFREHWEGFADAFDERGSGFGYTYVIGHTQLRIDHILAGPSQRFASCWVGPDVEAAHRPLVADVNSDNRPD